MATTRIRDEWNEKYDVTDGAAHVIDGVWQTPGVLTTRTVRFDATSEMPADITSNANVLADLVHLTFSGSAKRARVTFLAPVYGATDSAVCLGVFATLNAGTDTTAAARLTYSDVTGGNTSGEAVDSKTRMTGPGLPVIEWDLTHTEGTVEDIYLIGIPRAGTFGGDAEPAFVNVEVW